MTLAARPAEDGPITVTASTSGLNRYGFRLTPANWHISNYARNPVVLWMHDPFRPPIGRAEARLESTRLRAAITFDKGDELGREVDRKYRGGILHAVSVGFDFVKADGTPIADWWRLKNDEIAAAHYDLAEISAVSVPADAGAVREALSRRDGPTASAAEDEVLLQLLIRAAVQERRKAAVRVYTAFDGW